MRVSAVEELVIKRKRKSKNYWRDKSEWYWLRKLLGKLAGLTWYTARRHPFLTREELEQIASICMNWLERR